MKLKFDVRKGIEGLVFSQEELELLKEMVSQVRGCEVCEVKPRSRLMEYKGKRYCAYATITVEGNFNPAEVYQAITHIGSEISGIMIYPANKQTQEQTQK